MKLETWPGEPFPLGAHCDGKGTSFSVFSEAAESIELCLFDEHGKEHRLRMPDRTAYCWHGYVPGIKPVNATGFAPTDRGRQSRANASIHPSC